MMYFFIRPHVVHILGILHAMKTHISIPRVTLKTSAASDLALCLGPVLDCFQCVTFDVAVVLVVCVMWVLQ